MWRIGGFITLDSKNLKSKREAYDYFVQLPSMIQGQIIERGISIQSKKEMENLYQEILHSGPKIVGMDDLV